MNEAKVGYLSFLLRLWQVKENDHSKWLFSLENSRTGERFGFPDADKLCAFLSEQINTAADNNVDTDE